MSREGRYVENAGAYFRRCPRKGGMSKMQGDIGLSKCQQFGISPITRLRLWRRPEHIFDDVQGGAVCRKCRVISVFRNANSLAFRR
jgi:hypothetical protein